MEILRFRLGIWLRQGFGRLLVGGLLIGLVAGLAMGLAAGTRRTGSAPDRYTSWARGDPELEVLQLHGPPLTGAVASLPGVTGATGRTFVTSFPRGPDGTRIFEPNPFAGTDRSNGTRVLDGRFTDPRQPDEFTVNAAMAELLERRFGSRVGDAFPIESFSRTQLESNRAFASGDPPAVPTFTARWVGIVESPADFEVRTPAMYYSDGFLARHPTVGVVQTFVDVDLAPGAEAGDVIDEIHSLPGGEGAFATGARIVSAASRRVVGYQATALTIVTLISLLAAAAVIVQLVERSLRRSADERYSLAALGMAPRDFAIEAAVEAVAFVLVAVPVALLVAYGIAALFPLGALGVFEPNPGPLLDGSVVLVGVAGLLVAALGGAWLSYRGVPRRSRPTSAALGRRVLPAGTGLSVGLGTRLAIVGPSGTRRSVASLLLGVAGIAALLASVIVALNVDAIGTTPVRWGVNYDRLLGNPFVEADHDIVTPVQRERGITRLTAGHLGSLTIDGHDTPTIAIEPVKGSLLPTVLDGRAPTGPNEIALGAEIARSLDTKVGDRVTAHGSRRSTRSFRVVGTVVTPDSAGAGAVVTFRAYRSLNPDATRNVLFADFSPRASDRAVHRIVTANFTPPDAMPTPTSIQALRRVLPASVLLAIVLSFLLLVSCAFLLTISVRAQRRDLAILRALGAVRRQLLTMLHWEATLFALIVLLLGLPAGLVLGRWIVAQFTETLGVVSHVELYPIVFVLVALATLATANVLAFAPARRATRPSTDLLDGEKPR